MATLPSSLFHNSITPHLNEIRKSYIQLSGRGIIHGIMCIDQDARIIAVNDHYERKLGLYDIASLAAALFGISRQGIDSFGAENLLRSSLVYENLQFFTRSIGSFQLDNRGSRELLIAILADKMVNFGLIVLQMNRLAGIIKAAVAECTDIKKILKMNELEIRGHVSEIKNQIFRDFRSGKTFF